MLLGADGIAVNLANYQGWTPLISAVLTFNLEMVRALIAAGACVNFHAERRGLASQESVDSIGPCLYHLNDTWNSRVPGHVILIVLYARWDC
jgi:ankyrin repeat protein